MATITHFTTDWLEQQGEGERYKESHIEMLLMCVCVRVCMFAKMGDVYSMYAVRCGHIRCTDEVCKFKVIWGKMLV